MNEIFTFVNSLCPDAPPIPEGSRSYWEKDSLIGLMNKAYETVKSDSEFLNPTLDELDMELNASETILKTLCGNDVISKNSEDVLVF